MLFFLEWDQIKLDGEMNNVLCLQCDQRKLNVDVHNATTFIKFRTQLRPIEVRYNGEPNQLGLRWILK